MRKIQQTIEHINDEKSESTWNCDGGDGHHLIASQKRPAKSRTQPVPHLAIVNEDTMSRCIMHNALSPAH